MTKLGEYIQNVSFQDKTFIGTVAFRSEEKTLPNNSKVALGIDGDHWVLVYQEKSGAHFQVFECDWTERKVVVDKKPGGAEELKLFKQLVAYFIKEAQVEELVTILPPKI